MDSPMHWMLLLLLALELFSLVGAFYQSNSPLVTLDELWSLNASCGGLETCRCRYRGDEDMRKVNCQCGPYCVRYGTCCMDAPVILNGEVMEGYRKGLDCAYAVPNYYTKPVHLVQNCPKEWDGDDSIRDLCAADVAEAQKKSDLMLLVPVSSLKTGITYRNFFCYVCNTVDELNDSFISWNIKVIIPKAKESLFEDLSNLTYDPQRYRWTFPGAPEDFDMSLYPEPPAKLLENFSIYCRERDVVSSCAEDWTDDVTRAKCGYYTALVAMVTEEGFRTEYRNVHCGICNRARLATVQCSFASHDPSLPFEGSSKVFQEIFRISEMPEDRCPEGKLYDKVTKNCRNFRCGSKMKMVRGRCARKE